MSKSNEVRRALQRGEAVFTMDIARETGCTQPLVFQVIRAMKGEGELFEERQVGRRVTYRLLLGQEADQQRAARKRMEQERHRRVEIKRIREQLTAARATIDESLQALEVLGAA